MKPSPFLAPNRQLERRLLIVFRLEDQHGNKSTLRVLQSPDTTFHYSYYRSWNPSGIGLELNLNTPLPVDPRHHDTTFGLRDYIEGILEDSKKIVSEVEVLNNIVSGEDLKI